MTREEQAIKKFETNLTEKQQSIIKEKILRDAIMEAHTHMSKVQKARLYPSIDIHPSPGGLAAMMFNYGYATHQLWGKDDEGKWISYKYNS